jgi:tetratricopeptide (TPR) repeat protein
MALKVGLRAVEQAESSGEMDALARTYSYIDEAYQVLGRRDEAIHEEKALEIFEELGDLPGILLLAINLGVQAYSDGRWDDALAMYSKAQEVAQRSGNVAGEGAVMANLGELLISRGRLEEADAVLQEARRVLRGQNVVNFALFAETQLGRLMMEKGEVESTIESLKAVIDEATRVDHDLSAVDASIHLADAFIRSGEPLRAVEVIEETRRLAGEDAVLYEVSLERLYAHALVGMGRFEDARTHIERALKSAREQRLAYEEALLLVLESVATGDQEVFEKAVHLLEDLGASTSYFQRLPSATL